MTTEDIHELLMKAESCDLDWKRDFPPGLTNSKANNWEKAKATLIKDIISIANAFSNETGYLVYGVHDKGSEREVVVFI